MDERLNDIFEIVVKEYVKTARAVGSEFLAGNFSFNLSPATLRNDLVELEELGFLAKPHSSGGRVPTDKGWRYYIDCFLDDEESGIPAKAQMAVIQRHLRELSDEPLMAGIAKVLARLTRNVGIGAEPASAMFFTSGVHALFREPEFNEPADFQAAGDLFDDIDDYFGAIFSKLERRPSVFIGRENPYHNSRNYSVVAARVNDSNDEGRLIAILGPKRMNYRRNISVVNALSHLLKDF